MPDALSALDTMTDGVGEIASAINSARGKLLRSTDIQPVARRLAKTYFENVRSELLKTEARKGLTEEVDFVLQAVLELATGSREKASYQGQMNELKPLLLEATIELMKSAGAPRLVLSDTERAILTTLVQLVPPTSISYEQVLRDLGQGQRISWRGTAAEMREVLREVMDHLAPDDKVMSAPGFQLETDQKRPTQKQKVRFILRARKSSSSAMGVAEASLSTVDEAIANLARSTYQRGSTSTHTSAGITEIRNLKRYIDALLGELLEIG